MVEFTQKVIAIDGPSGSGKSTLARGLARRLGWHYLDSGAIYRTVGMMADALGFDLEDDAACGKFTAEALLEVIELPVTGNPDQNVFQAVLIDGHDLSVTIRTRAGATAASRISALPKVRAEVTDFIRRHVGQQQFVIDGRDIGTVVFPQAELKIWLDADVRAREARIQKLSHETVQEDLDRRDRFDAERTHAPAVAANDAVIIDTTSLDSDLVLAHVIRLTTIVNRD